VYQVTRCTNGVPGVPGVPVYQSVLKCTGVPGVTVYLVLILGSTLTINTINNYTGIEHFELRTTRYSRN
jgi:hypothetical protein